MQGLADVVLAGLLQGFLEWLPVSSSGQVTLFYAAVLGVDPAAAYRAGLALHAGTALSALTVYWRGFLEALRRPLGPLGRMLVVTTLSAAPLGYAVLRATEGALEGGSAAAEALVGVALLATAVVLAAQPPGRGRRVEEGTLLDWVLVGLAEGAAALPGLSRSGLTITVLLLRGFSPREAVRASFMAAVPVTLAAGVYAGRSLPAPEALAGLASSYAAGLAGLAVMDWLAARAGPRGFAAFAAAVGAIALALALPALLAG